MSIPPPAEANSDGIRPRDRDAILQALQAGLVPRRGLQYIQVGRARELEALTRDIDRVADGGASVRFVIGDYGSGKTFFLNLVRSIALEKRLVTAHADLTPERRLYSTDGHARALYAELMQNLATRASPDGGAMEGIVQRFVAGAAEEAKRVSTSPDRVIQERLRSLQELAGGYDFAHVVAKYWRAHEEGDDEVQAAAVRWLRGGYTSKMDARAALGVRTVIDDAAFYDATKVLARFVRLAGYGGLVICVDEMVNLYKIPHGVARKNNYEKLLAMVNDGLQGNTANLGLLFAGTPDFLTDPRRGLYSYEALRSRLAENAFARGGLVDVSGPVVRLPALTPEEFFVLLRNLRRVHSAGDHDRPVLPDEALHAFMAHCHQRIGTAYFQTPRNTIKAFLGVLSILDQNPGVLWQDLVRQSAVESDASATEDRPPDDAAPEQPPGEDKLATFRL